MNQLQPIRSIDLFCNDLYEFTCSYAYFIQGKHEQTATFDLFFRKYPFKGEYVIFAGLESVKEFVRNLKFTESHEKYLKSIFPHMKEEYFAWLKQDFSKKITVRAMKQGQIVFANQPLLGYTGPLGFVQLFETPSLNLLGFASLVATNASRMAKIVAPRSCIQFGTRRAQGPDGALSAAQYAYIGGFSATSNVLCAQKFHIPCSGTMSHAYVTSFSSLDDIKPVSAESIKMKKRVIQKRDEYGFKTHEGQLASFLNFALAYPHNFTTLIDTYSTLQSGILNSIIVGSVLIEMGVDKIGVRLDSGDLGALSKQCRKIWDSYISDVRLKIVASDDLYEERLIDLIKDKSQIDMYAIGTNIATCKKQPALGVVFKLVELDGVPKMKLSSSPEKATYPCVKNIFRVMTDTRQFFDLIALQDEMIQVDQDIRVGTIKDKKMETKKFKSIRVLNEEINLFNEEDINDIKAYVQKSTSELPEKTFEIESPQAYKVYMTQKYLNLFHETHDLAEKYLSGTKPKQKEMALTQLDMNAQINTQVNSQLKTKVLK